MRRLNRFWTPPSAGESSNETVVVLSNGDPNNTNLAWLEDQPYRFMVLTRGYPVGTPDNMPSMSTR
jgi:hypothetical protein